MAKCRNIVFVIVLAVFLLGVISYKAYDFGAQGNNLPTSSIIEGREYTKMPALSLKSVSSHDFQNAFEAYLSDSIPLRDHTILTNAALQRFAIQIANLPFDHYSCHTFYDSDFVYNRDSDSLSYAPNERFTKAYKQDIYNYIDELKKVAELYPDKRFVVFVPAGGRNPDLNNRYYNQISNAATPQLIKKAFAEALGDTDNITLLTDAGLSQSPDDYYKYYFRTDHHWNARGALRAYNLIAEVLNKPRLDFGEEDFIDGFSFSGSFSRSGLMLLRESVSDSSIDYENVLFTETKDKRLVNGNDHMYFYDHLDESRFRFYENYFTYSAEFDGSGQGTALLVSDSYGFGIVRPLATAYAKLFRVSHLSSSTKEGNLIASIDEKDPDDIILIGLCIGYRTQLNRIPDYFD